MASTTVWDVKTTGSVNNGAGFNIGNANFMTDLTCTANTGNTATPEVSSVTYSFQASDVGYHVFIKSGTNWTPGFYAITSVASGKATLDAAIGHASLVGVLGVASGNTQNGDFTLSTVVGCSTVGTPTAGVFGIDYSQGNSAINTATDLVTTDGTTNPSHVSSASKPFAINHTGNYIKVTAGTNWTVQHCEIVSVSAGVALLDKAAASVASSSGGTFYLGGCATLANTAGSGSATSAGSGGNRLFIQSGTYSGVCGNASTSLSPQFIYGYKTYRGDVCTGADLPVLSCQTNGLFLAGAANTRIFNIYFYMITGNTITYSSASYTENCKLYGVTAGMISTSGVSTFVNCEIISPKAQAFTPSAELNLIGCYIHHTQNIATLAATSKIINCVFDNIYSGFTLPALGVPTLIANNTFYGSESKQMSYGIFLQAGGAIFWNNIIYGFTNAVKHNTSGNIFNYGDHNNYYNNTANYLNVIQGRNDTFLNPGFVVSTITGSTASIAGAVMTDLSGNFNNVVDGYSYCYITSGASWSFTGTCHRIMSHTPTSVTFEVTTGVTNATTNHVYEITYSRNFTPNTNMKAAAIPSKYSDGNQPTNNYLDTGAVQRIEPLAGSGSVSSTYIGS